MATVRITKRLIEDITRQAKQLFDVRLSEVRGLPQDFGDRAYEAWLEAGEREIIDFLISKGRDLELYYEKTDRVWVIYLDGRAVREKVTFSKPIYLVGGTLNVTGPTAAVLWDEYCEWVNQRQAIQNERDTYVKELETFLKEQPSLNRAIAEWPALKELLDEHTLEQLRKPNTKKPRNAKKTANLGVLNAGIVKAKFLEAR